MVKHEHEQPLGHLLAYTSRLLVTLMHRNFRKSGFELSHEQWILLLNLWKSEEPGLSQQELGVRTGKDKASVTRLVQGLEEAGLIMRKVDPRDARIRQVFATEKSRELEQATETVMIETRAQMQKGFSEVELKQFRDLMNRFRINAEDCLGRRSESIDALDLVNLNDPIPAQPVSIS
jgi:DNA-binding MarR family transcriptional regulator